MVTSSERGREVRQRLLSAAAELIAERGWAAVSTRLLAERAGVAGGLVHYHFPSLRALLSEAAVGVLRQLADQVDSVLADATTPQEAVDRMLGGLDEYSGRDPVSLLFVETYLAATRDPSLAAAVAAVVAEVRGRFADWLAMQGVPDPADTAATVVAAIDGVMLHRALDPGLTSGVVAPVLGRSVR